MNRRKCKGEFKKCVGLVIWSLSRESSNAGRRSGALRFDRDFLVPNFQCRRSLSPHNDTSFAVGADATRRVSFARPGLVVFHLVHPRLAPLRQAQDRLWAAFCRRFAAGPPSTRARRPRFHTIPNFFLWTDAEDVRLGCRSVALVVSFAPSGLVAFCGFNSHGLRRGLHSFAASRLAAFPRRHFTSSGSGFSQRHFSACLGWVARPGSDGWLGMRGERVVRFY